MQRPENPVLGTKYIVGLDSNDRPHHVYYEGEIVSLYYDDETCCPEFVNDNFSFAYVDWDRLTPVTPELAPAVIAENVVTLEVCRQIVEAEGFVAMAQAELDNAREMLENRLHELNQLKAKYNIQ